MEHKVASRFNKKYAQDKCPICLAVHHNFIEVSDKELACYYCGIIFLNKETRDGMLRASKEMQIKQGKDSRTFVCDCGFKSKTNAGLKAHQRKCK